MEIFIFLGLIFLGINQPTFIDVDKGNLDSEIAAYNTEHGKRIKPGKINRLMFTGLTPFSIEVKKDKLNKYEKNGVTIYYDGTKKSEHFIKWLTEAKT